MTRHEPVFARTLMLNLSDETIVSLSDATKLLPRRRAGKRPHISCLYRWARHGFRGIRLEVIRVGGTLCTSREALERFIEQTTAADPLIQQTSPNDSRTQGRDAVERELDDLGF
jgi:hypothetical protein